jgi:predicted nucleic acid-binding protein
MFDTNIFIYASIQYPQMETFLHDHYVESLENIIMPQVIQAELKSIPRIEKDLIYKSTIESYINQVKSEGNIVPLNDDIIDLAAEVRAKCKTNQKKDLLYLMLL